MDHLLDYIDTSCRIITLDQLTERADLECELWQLVQRPAGPANARRREHLLYHWRKAKRAARREATQKHLIEDLAQLLSQS